MVISRKIAPFLLKLAQQYPVVSVMGPRQSGKTTLVKQSFPSYAYVSLEEIDNRVAAKEDPRKFFATYAHYPGLIIDEIQEVPELFSYMQGIVDKEYKPGYFIITGSQNFLMFEKITQSLAGRIALLTLLPFTVEELSNSSLIPSTLEETMFKGFYPPLYTQKVESPSWLSYYISMYLERDVRQVTKVGDILTFQKFIKLCAARIGNLVNFAELARDAEISTNTAKSWISILETSYVITLLPSHHKSFNKRVIKSPKLYFNDIGIVCSLLGIKQAQDLFTHPIRGALFENFVISELYKYHYNRGIIPQLYFWQDVEGHEVDCIIEKSYNTLIPIEIKSGMTVKPDFFKGILYWNKIADHEEIPSYVVWGGNENQKRTHADVIAWNQINKIFDE